MDRSFLKKMAAAGLALATIGGTMVATTGSAEAYWRHHNRGWGVGAGILGGLAAGALIAGAARPAYAAPAYGGYPVYEEPAYGYAPACHFERRQVWIDDYRWTYRRVRVCY